MSVYKHLVVKLVISLVLLFFSLVFLLKLKFTLIYSHFVISFKANESPTCMVLGDRIFLLTWSKRGFTWQACWIDYLPTLLEWQKSNQVPDPNKLVHYWVHNNSLKMIKRLLYKNLLSKLIEWYDNKCN